MTPSLLTNPGFLVSGLSTRTRNSDEIAPAGGKIGPLWTDFFSRGVAEIIPNRVPDEPIYGVYSAYESDASGAFDVTAGVAVTAASPEYANVTVAPGRYLVFECRGDMPAMILNGWAAVWAYFQNNADHQRAYATDFEAWYGVDHVAIHIGIV